MDKKKSLIAKVAAVTIFFVLVIYLIGLGTELIQMYIKHKITEISFNPLTAYKFAFDFPNSYIVWIVVVVIAVMLLAHFYSLSDNRGKLDSKIRKESDRNFEYSGKETYGSAKMMSEKEVKKIYNVVSNDIKGIEKTEGAMLFGFLNDKKKAIVAMPKNDWKKGTDFNRNYAVAGPPGSGKTRSLVLNYVLQKILAGESIVIVDTKGEIYETVSSFADSQGYECKLLDLVEQRYSDGWDILGEVENDPDMATILASTIIKNTGGSKSDPFWNDAEMNILKAVILLKSVGRVDVSNITGKKQTMGDVYKYIATRKITIKEGRDESMESDFQFLIDSVPNHPAITPFLQFMNAGSDLCKKILHGLANRLQLFQNAQLSKVLGTKDIDLLEVGRRKSIYFLRFSDQTSTYSFITALFFAIMSVKLVRYADSTAERTLPVPVNLVLDEFCNIGAIPDFEIKMATFRSRLINVLIIFQNLMLLQATYPDGIWEAILGTCDTTVLLGVGNELTTGEYMSKLTGEATTAVSSASVMLADTSQIKQTSSTGKRYVRTADEIRRMDKKKALVFLRSNQVMEVHRMDYTENPIYRANKEYFVEPNKISNRSSKVEKVDIDYSSYSIDKYDRTEYSQRGNNNRQGAGNNEGQERDSGSSNPVAPKPTAPKPVTPKPRGGKDNLRDPSQKKAQSPRYMPTGWDDI